MKRVYYIANAYDGSYFVLTDQIDEYFRRLASYAMNLEQSQKLNHYSFGSVEMSIKDYELQQTEAKTLESSLIQQKTDGIDRPAEESQALTTTNNKHIKETK